MSVQKVGKQQEFLSALSQANSRRCSCGLKQKETYRTNKISSSSHLESWRKEMAVICALCCKKNGQNTGKNKCKYQAGF